MRGGDRSGRRVPSRSKENGLGAVVGKEKVGFELVRSRELLFALETKGRKKS